MISYNYVPRVREEGIAFIYVCACDRFPMLVGAWSMEVQVVLW